MSIPASLFANVQPGVLSAGGSALDLKGLVLTTNARVPIGTVQSFPNPAAVAAYFGPASKEAEIAGGGTSGAGDSLGSGYFGGYVNATKVPAAILFTQYPTTAVGAWLRGGNISGLSIAALQALNGTVSLTVDGSFQLGTVDFSSANSFSAAATLLATALNTATAATGSVAANVVTGTISPNVGTGSIAGTTMTISAVSTGAYGPGQTVTGAGVAAGTTIVSQLSGTAGSTGTYQVSLAQTVSSTTLTSSGGTLNASAVTTGTLFVGQTLSGSGVTSGTKITAFLTGTGGTGKYAVDTAQTVGSTTITGTGGTLTISAVSAGTFGLGDVFSGSGITVGNEITAFLTGTGTTGTYLCSVGDTAGSTAISVAGASVAVTYDSTAGAFNIASGTTGPSSTITYATGSLSASLLLTNATGAVTSQGSAAASPAAFMNGVTAQTQNWATFMTAFDPDGGSGFANKKAFADWKNGQNNRYAYVCFDTDASPTTQNPATGSLGYALKQEGDSGTCLIYEPRFLNYAAFVCGFAASIDFQRKNGRATLAYRRQDGLVPSVTDATTAVNLGGNPQSVGDYGNGYNYYGDIATANQDFINFQRGTVTGQFQWFDSYVNQIWLNNSFQLALMNLLQNSGSIPYNAAGNATIEAALADPINAGLNFGAFRAGVQLSAAQISAVNTAAGVDIATTLQNQGWYLQIGIATAQVRQSRGTPPLTFWFVDGESIQSFNLASVLIQ